MDSTKLAASFGIDKPIKATYNPKARKRGQRSVVPSMDEIMEKHRAKMASAGNQKNVGRAASAAGPKKKTPASHLNAGLAEIEPVSDLDKFLK